MKILYAAASAVPSKAANSVHVVKMAQALANNGHQVTLVAPKPRNTDITENIYQFYGVVRNFDFIDVTTKPNKFSLLAYGMGVVKKAHSMRARFIFTRCLPTAFIATLTNTPVLYERHSDFWGNKIQESVYKIMAALPAHKGTVVVSQALKNYYVDELGTNAAKVFVAADGSDPINIEPSIRPPFDKNTGRKNIGYIGHLYKGRGIDVIADLAHMRPQYDFHIVGGNEEDLAFWRNELKSLPNMIFYGHIPHAKTKDFILNFDAVLAPYQKKVAVAHGLNTEKWMSPLKIFESMSSGKPLICSDMPVLHEVLEDGTNCLLCQPEDRDEWAAALDKVLLDESYGAAIAERALKDFLEKYTWQKRAENIVEAVFGAD